jgi:ankyrin repeat protein
MERAFQQENVATQKLAKKLCKAIYNDDIPYVKDAVKDHLIMHTLVPHFAFNEKVSAIHVAAAENEECLKLLLQHGASPVIKTRQFQFSPLHYASSATAAQLLFEHGAYIDQKDGTGQTPFFHCMHMRNDHSRYARARFFLQEGADINVADRDTGDTPLHCAHDRKMVNFLLGNGADASLKNNAEQTPFEENCEYIVGSESVFTECGNFFFPPQDRLDQPWMHDLFLSQCQYAISLIKVNDHAALKAYIKKYPFITLYDDVLARQMLYAAIQQPDDQCLNVLLKNQINSDVEFCESYSEGHVCTQQCKSRGNALHAAVFFGNTAAIHLLVPYQADILMRDAAGRTPMEYAIAAGKPHCVAALNEALSVYFVRSMVADTAGHEYGMYQKCKNILSQIYQINAQCPFSGSTLLHQACYFACDTKLRYVSLLLAAGADLYMRDYKGRTSLFFAVRGLSNEVCELLLSYEVLLRAGKTHQDSEFGGKKHLDWINAVDNKGRSALAYTTVKLYMFASVPLLLRYGARVTQEMLDSSSWARKAHRILQAAYVNQQVSKNEKI